MSISAHISPRISSSQFTGRGILSLDGFQHNKMPGPTPLRSGSASPPLPPPAPTPPPPPRCTNPPHTETPSPYLSKLESAPKDWLSRPVPHNPPVNEDTWAPSYYFFYGTLTRPDILKHILDLETEPTLRKTKVVGYDLTDWGQYKALVDGEPGNEVTGCAFEVESVEHEYKLAYYETSAYELAPCLIKFTDAGAGEPEEIIGKTFMYAGDSRALREGRFDRRLWELQMGSKLPRKWREGGGG